MRKFMYKDYIIEVENCDDMDQKQLKKNIFDSIKAMEHSKKHHIEKDSREGECCICHKHIDGWGNNPWGALDENGEVIAWKDDDECCDNCNNKYVLSGRLYKAGVNKDFVPVRKE